MTQSNSRIMLILFVVAAAVVPLVFASGYQLFQLTLVVAYALSVLGKNLVTGYGGQVSLGQGAFYAVGAYTAAILMEHFNVPYWATLPVAAVVSTKATCTCGASLAPVMLMVTVAVPKLVFAV
jgi:branched-chain amino acid transport system permease protein